jgi:hypothetical protein
MYVGQLVKQFKLFFEGFEQNGISISEEEIVKAWKLE